MFLVHSSLGHCKNRAHCAAENPPWVRHVLQHLPRFWSIIADYPRLIINDGEEDNSTVERDENEEGYNECLVHLLLAQMYVKHVVW